MDDPSRDQERAFYRLRYPQADRPQIQIDDQTHEVSEISEGGARIVLSDTTSIGVDQSFQGVIHFHDDETAAIEGIVLRSDENEIVVNLTSGVSLKRMMAEQIRIRQKYPEIRNPAERSDDEAT